MSEGIVELEGTKEVEDEEPNCAASQNEEKASIDESTCIGVRKPKTRRQKRDKRKRLFEDQKKARDRDVKLREIEVSRLKSIKRELKAKEEQAVENEAKRKKAVDDKFSGPMKLSNYDYQPQDIEIKFSDELTGNLRNLKPEGSLLEDRYKSLQRRNIIETLVVQKAVRQKTKKVDKRSHKMGWEE